MTITECITNLEKIKTKQGDIEVYFDCPECEHSFTPNKIALIAVHLTEDNELIPNA